MEIFFTSKPISKGKFWKWITFSITKNWKRMLKIVKGQNWGCHLHKLQCPTTDFWFKLDGDQILIAKHCTLSMTQLGPNPTHDIFQSPCRQGFMTKNQSQPTLGAIENQLWPKLEATELVQFPCLTYNQIWKILVAS